MKTCTAHALPVSVMVAGLLGAFLPLGALSAAGPPATTLLDPRGLVDDTRRPEFSWQTVAGADQYYVWVARNGTVFRALWVGATAWTPGEDLPGGSYRWWVRTHGAGVHGAWSTSADFSIPVTIPGKVVQLGPSGSASSSQPMFSWEPEQAASEYHLWSRRNGVFALEAKVPAPASEHTPASRLADGMYDWWLRASSPDGHGAWSGPMSFHIGRPLAPGAVKPLAPSGTIMDAFPRFEWTGVSNAESYYLWITRGGKKHRDVRVEADTEWVSETQFPPGSYTWWVRAENPSANGPWSSAGSFSLVYPAEPVAELLYPDVEGFDCQDQIWSMIWRGDEYATWVRIQVNANDHVVVDAWIEIKDEDSNIINLPEDHFVYVNTDFLNAGEYVWRVQHYRPGQGVGAWSDWSGFVIYGPTGTPEPPTDLRVNDTFWPLGTDACSRPVFHWSGAAQATSYSVDIDEKPGFGYPAHYEGSSLFGWRQQLNAETMNSGTYRFTVQAENNYGTVTAVSEYFKVGSPPIDTRLQIPIHGIQLEQVGSRLCLSADVTRNVYGYQTYVSMNGNMMLNRQVDLDEEPEAVVDGRFELMLPGSAKSGTYSSWVRCYSVLHSRSCREWTQGPIVVVKSPSAPVPIGPVNLVDGIRPAFTWNPVEHVDRYRLYVSWNGKPYVDRIIELPDDYMEQEESNSFAEVGTPMNWRDYRGTWSMGLPFAFPFYGGVYTQVYVRANGTLSFLEPPSNHQTDLEANRFTVPTILVYGDGMQSTEEPGCDIFTVKDATSCTIRWVTRNTLTMDDEREEIVRWLFEQVMQPIQEHLPDDLWDYQYGVTLYPDGRIRFIYGPNKDTEMDVGLSAGDRVRRHVCAVRESYDLQSRPDIVLTPRSTPGWDAHWDFPNGNYQWWIRAQRGTTDSSPWAPGGGFIVDEM